MSLLLEELLTFGMLAFPTAEQGDCGLDVMVYWDGQNRAALGWKTLRLELAVAIEAAATDTDRHSTLQACAELPLPETGSAASLAGPAALAEAPAALAGATAAMAARPQGSVVSAPDQAELAAALAYLFAVACVRAPPWALEYRRLRYLQLNATTLFKCSGP